MGKQSGFSDQRRAELACPTLYKVRLVTQGFAQVYGINYVKTFTQIIRYKSLRIFVIIIAMMNMILIQIDVIGTYFESALC